MFERVEKTIQQCNENAKQALRQCRDGQGIGDRIAECVRSTTTILEESNSILRDTGKKIDALVEVLYSWRDRALAAEERVQELEAQPRTEMCENGYDCVILGKERSRVESAEAERDMWAKLANDRSTAYQEMRDRAVAAETENKRLHGSLDYARTKDAEIIHLGGKLDKAEMLLRDLLTDCSDAISAEKPIWPEWWQKRVKEYFGIQEE